MAYIDPDGRQTWGGPFWSPPRPQPRTVKCGGVCGASIDNWIINEINGQIAGWNNWKKANPGKDNIGDYIPWSNGNQRYKDPDFFKFNTGTGCGTKDTGTEVGCGMSVTLCGQCVRSSILGNIMYGIIGNYAGFSDQEMRTASTWKRRVGMPVDRYDEDAYQFGAGLNGLVNIGDFCKKFNELLKSNNALREGRSDGGYNDLSSCRPCNQQTTAKNHGGNESPRWRP